MSRRYALLLGYGLIILGVCLPLSVLVWRAFTTRPDTDWQRYSDRRLGLSWSAPASWRLRALQSGSERTLVLSPANGSEFVLYLSATTDQVVYRRWDPASANTLVAGQPASDIRLPAGQNPAQRLVSLRAGADRLVLLSLFYSPEFNQADFDRLLASLKLQVEEANIRLFAEIDSLSEGWQPCTPDCGLAGASPNWCAVDVAAGEWNGIDVYSNGSNFPYFYYNECPDFYGLKFQCVELIQRYYWEVVGRNTGTGGPGWGIASAYQAWWQHPPEYDAVENGSGGIPHAGDVLVWRLDGRYAPHGHVGIVVQVTDDQVIFVQQNSKEGGVSTRAWVNGWIDDPNLYGWLHLSYGDHMPPDGAITMPADGSDVTGDRLHLEGWAEDSATGLASAQFYATYDGRTVPIGQPYTSSPFSYDWDLKAANLPNVPLTITLRLEDKVGNVAYSPRGIVQLDLRRPFAGLEPPDLLGDCRDLMANGSFEVNKNWLLEGNLMPEYTASSAVIGKRALQLGIVSGANLVGVSLAQQTVQIPPDAARLRLRFSYYAQSGVWAVYPQRLYLYDAQGVGHELLALAAPDSYTRAWRQIELDESILGQFRGQKVRLQFQVYNNGWDPTPAYLLVDNVQFYACR
ncbi:MAG: CHAP domain-containing protein [Anaerolineae bacterium]